MSPFRSLEPLLRVGIGLFAVALAAGLTDLAARWLGIPVVTLFVRIGMGAVLIAVVVASVLYLRKNFLKR